MLRVVLLLFVLLLFLLILSAFLSFFYPSKPLWAFGRVHCVLCIRHMTALPLGMAAWLSELLHIKKTGTDPGENPVVHGLP